MILAWLSTGLACAVALPEGRPVGRDPPSVSACVQALDFGDLPRGARQVRTVLADLAADWTALAFGADCTCLSGALVESGSVAGQPQSVCVTLETCDYIGEVRRRIWLGYAGTDRVVWSLPVRYRVVPEVFADPPVLSFGIVDSDRSDGEAAEIAVATAGLERIEIVAVTCDAVWATATIERESIEIGKPGRIRITLDTVGLDRPLQASLLVATTSPEVPVLRIPLLGEVTNRIRPQRDDLDFGAVGLGSSEVRELQLELSPGTSVRDMRPTNEAIDVFAVTRTADSIVVRMRSSSQLPLGSFNGMLLLELGDAPARRMRLPYRGQVIEPRTPSIGSASNSQEANARNSTAEPTWRP